VIISATGCKSLQPRFDVYSQQDEIPRPNLGKNPASAGGWKMIFDFSQRTLALDGDSKSSPRF
jgi:hypothetical protein